ncbi:tyrosine-type recombinase/integrase [uncultured Roseobacter sp.]|uniref:tyrosine-type recombinase/integrase n=1 Tax=uncultured Roseobacter sp. TaxID=114847 RepID=UPI00260ACA4A|nr:tyrosine-type recombinase/integrase [uncultured Roseobacter sp.]
MKGIRRVRQDGKQYRYHRATGTRLPDDIPETHPAFLKAYLAAEEQLSTGHAKPTRGATPKTGSIAHGWWQFCRSENFMELSEGYRASLHRHGEAIIERGGKVPFDQIRDRHIQADISDLPRNAARMRLKTWRALLGFLKAKGKITANPAKAVEMPTPKKPEKHKAWSTEQVKAFRNRWPIGTQQRLAMELMLFSGCRICDAIRLGPGMVDSDGWLRYTQKKTKGKVEVPFRRALPSFADHEAHSNLSRSIDELEERHMTWLVTAYGSTRSEKAASNWFSSACRGAGLKDGNRRTAHGLRVTCLTRMSERAATTHQLGAWAGHESLKEIEEYTKTAAKREMLSANETDTKIVQVTKS